MVAPRSDERDENSTGPFLLCALGSSVVLISSNLSCSQSSWECTVTVVSRFMSSRVEALSVLTWFDQGTVPLWIDF